MIALHTSVAKSIDQMQGTYEEKEQLRFCVSYYSEKGIVISVLRRVIEAVLWIFSYSEWQRSVIFLQRHVHVKTEVEREEKAEQKLRTLIQKNMAAAEASSPKKAESPRKQTAAQPVVPPSTPDKLVSPSKAQIEKNVSPQPAVTAQPVVPEKPEDKPLPLKSILPRLKLHPIQESIVGELTSHFETATSTAAPATQNSHTMSPPSQPLQSSPNPPV